MIILLHLLMIYLYSTVYLFSFVQVLNEFLLWTYRLHVGTAYITHTINLLSQTNLNTMQLTFSLDYILSHCAMKDYCM